MVRAARPPPAARLSRTGHLVDPPVAPERLALTADGQMRLVLSGAVGRAEGRSTDLVDPRTRQGCGINDRKVHAKPATPADNAVHAIHAIHADTRRRLVAPLSAPAALSRRGNARTFQQPGARQDCSGSGLRGERPPKMGTDDGPGVAPPWRA
jgi:hypothetical protein